MTTWYTDLSPWSLKRRVERVPLERRALARQLWGRYLGLLLLTLSLMTLGLLGTTWGVNSLGGMLAVCGFILGAQVNVTIHNWKRARALGPRWGVIQGPR